MYSGRQVRLGGGVGPLCAEPQRKWRGRSGQGAPAEGQVIEEGALAWSDRRSPASGSCSGHLHMMTWALHTPAVTRCARSPEPHGPQANMPQCTCLAQALQMSHLSPRTARARCGCVVSALAIEVRQVRRFSPMIDTRQDVRWHTTSIDMLNADLMLRSRCFDASIDRPLDIRHVFAMSN